VKSTTGSAYVLAPLLLNILLIVTTEKTITHNRVGPEEAYWTFGQTLALIVALPYFIGVCKQLIEALRRRSKRKHPDASPADEDQETLAQEDGSKIELMAQNP
jgi:hypothetical protein